MKKTIVINGRFLSQPTSGVQRYAREIVKALDNLLSENKELLEKYSFKLIAPKNSNCDIELSNIKFETFAPYKGHIWEQLFFPFYKSDFVINLCNSGPLFKKNQIVTIHDAAVQRHPEHFSKLYYLVHSTFAKIITKNSKIATVSNFSRNELSEIFNLNSSDILVCPNGCEHLFGGHYDNKILSDLGVEANKYFVCVGNMTKNKNMVAAVRAIELLGDDNIKLVIVGARNAKVFGETFQTNSQNIIIAGRLSDDELKTLLHNSKALLFPSLYEGFGIPPLEAFINNTLVLASNIPPIREVCSDAAIYFEPHNYQEIADKMKLVNSEDFDRDAYLNKAKERVKIYNWKASANNYIDYVNSFFNKG